MNPQRRQLSDRPCALRAQDEFASRAGISRSHMGKIERGEHVPTLPLILKISVALRISAAELMAATERNLRAETDL